MAITSDTVIRRLPGLITEPVLDDMVVLDPAGGRYVRLNRTAAALWDALDDAATLGSLAHLLEDRFGVSSEQARADAVAFVEATSSRRLIESAAFLRRSRELSPDSAR